MNRRCLYGIYVKRRRPFSWQRSRTAPGHKGVSHGNSHTLPTYVCVLLAWTRYGWHISVMLKRILECEGDKVTVMESKVKVSRMIWALIRQRNVNIV
jgi:hypothetical protein